MSESEISVRQPTESSPNPLWLLVLALVAVLLCWIANIWRCPTRVELELLTRRLAFTVGGEKPLEILNTHAAFSSMVIEECDVLELSPRKLAVADPQQYRPATPGQAGGYAESAWHRLTAAGRLKVAFSDPDAKVTLQGSDPAAETLGTLDILRLAPGTQVILEVNRGRLPEVTVEISPPEPEAASSAVDSSLAIAIHSELDLVTAFVDIEGADPPPFAGDLLTYRADLRSPDHRLDLRWTDRLTLVAVASPQAPEASFSIAGSIPVAAVELLEERRGVIGTPLLEPGRLTYPQVPEIEPVTIAADELVGLHELGTSQLQSLELDAASGGLRLRFDGVVGRARSTDRAFETDHRLTLWDRHRHGLWVLLVSVFLVVLFTLWKWYDRWLELLSTLWKWYDRWSKLPRRRRAPVAPPASPASTPTPDQALPPPEAPAASPEPSRPRPRDSDSGDHSKS